MNTGGSVLCSNCSFSSLLSSPNTDADSSPSIILDGATTLEYVDGREYSFDSTNLSTSACFSHCLFIGDKYPSARPLTFNEYKGSISILSCSFVDHTYTKDDGHVTDDALNTSCRFDQCSSTGGGALCLRGYKLNSHTPLAQLSDCIIVDCSVTLNGGGVIAEEEIDLSVVNTKFERCGDIDGSGCFCGGAIASMDYKTKLTVEDSYFIECRASDRGGAIYKMDTADISISYTLVQNCYSGTTGALSFEPYFVSGIKYSFLHVYFDGNMVGENPNWNQFEPQHHEQTFETDLIDLSFFDLRQ
ncbi:hypothetical protein BLNAU_21275 [Blattamonas nauphoetae]|uniref:Right handed beta helix domain-containing protein n=1 Tax=Blattamonas nauphoetae TaxID=2049346 RepID=A0ABQ9WYL8_9EUKA|nr:hypothetical protein BLNAU_21275 [Blattamonas nauphoetae]